MCKACGLLAEQVHFSLKLRSPPPPPGGPSFDVISEPHSLQPAPAMCEACRLVAEQVQQASVPLLRMPHAWKLAVCRLGWLPCNRKVARAVEGCGWKRNSCNKMACPRQTPPSFHLQVHVLGRMGEAARALELIIGRLADVPAAIAFVQVGFSVSTAPVTGLPWNARGTALPTGVGMEGIAAAGSLLHDESSQ